MRFQAVLFDVDGTLIHSSPGILQTLQETFRQMGVDCSGFDMQQYLGPPLRRTFARHFSDPEDVERAVLLYRALYKTSGQFACSLFPGVETMLRTLHEAGVVLCTATSKPAEVARPILEHLGIDLWFDVIGGAALDSSLDTKTAVMQHVLAQPALAGRSVLMVGDRKDDMEGARNCGLPAAGVLYGYGSREELEPFAPAFLAPDCESLTRFILTSNPEERRI